ncbi:MAG TPA: signal recognition particle-docking protein FtsY [Terriglobia bacterium]|nr:signal recognition particle-docking protein FtsY [Terriglobia bacterium]
MVQTLFGPPEKKTSIFDRLKGAVASTKNQLVDRIEGIVEGKEKIEPDVLDDLEATLIAADLGVKTTQGIMTNLRTQVDRRQLTEAKQLRGAVEQQILAVLENAADGPRPAPKHPPAGAPEVIFMIGVNGVGKTTSIAKLANFYLQQGRRPLLCAADTFRAAAIEQLEIWAHRIGIELVKQKPGADPSAVIFDALAAAKRRKDDLVIVDTAGRLHTKHNLMSELEKMCRISAREIPGAPHQVLLVLDATTGQNGLAQARQFTDRVGTTGIILTKLDGTAKGGVIVGIARELRIPIQFVGIGEKVEDLLPFNPKEFVASLFES